MLNYFDHIAIKGMTQVGYSGINVTGGGGGGPTYFFGSKIFNSCIFWVEDLTMYFLGSEKSACIFYVFFWV